MILKSFIPICFQTARSKKVYIEYIEYIEKTDAKDGFHHAACFLPAYRWENVDGFTPEEIARYQEVIESTVHLILEFARQGGFENASGF